MTSLVILNNFWIPILGIIGLVLAYFLLVLIFSLIGRATNTRFTYWSTTIEPFKTPKEIKEESHKSELISKENDRIKELNTFCDEFETDEITELINRTENQQHKKMLNLLFDPLARKTFTPSIPLVGNQLYLSKKSHLIENRGNSEKVLLGYKNLKELLSNEIISYEEYHKLGKELYQKSIQ